MTKYFLRSLAMLCLMSGAALAQDLDAAKYAQPPIPTLLPAAIATAEENAAAKAKAATPSALATAGTSIAGAPATPPPSADNGKVVSPTPILVSTDTVQKRQSIFFTPNQLISIMRANQGFIAPHGAFDSKNQGDKPQDNGPRVLALTGLIYHSDRDWTIWLNGERVTPKNIPDRIMGLTVKADHINLRWMDIGNQRIVNITLHPNQQYLLDSDTIIMGSQ